MTDYNYEENFIKMSAIGRHLRVGDLYHYNKDVYNRKGTGRIIEEDSVHIEECSKVKVSSSNSDKKWEHMKLDGHTQASLLAGLVDKFCGASNYLTDRVGLSQVSRVVVVRATTRKASVDLTDDGVIIDERQCSKSMADGMHVVVGVTYGAEIYCVIYEETKSSDKSKGHRESDEDDDSDDDEDSASDEDEGRMIETVTSEMVNALRKQLEPEDFKRKVSSKLEKNSIKCRLYSDLSNESDGESISIFKAYRHCLKMMRTMSDVDRATSKEVAISYQLCPLNAIRNSTSRSSYCDYVETDEEPLNYFSLFFQQFDRILSEASAMNEACRRKQQKVSLRKFIKAVNDYKENVQQRLKTAILKKREQQCNSEENEDDSELSNEQTSDDDDSGSRRKSYKNKGKGSSKIQSRNKRKDVVSSSDDSSNDYTVMSSISNEYDSDSESDTTRRRGKMSKSLSNRSNKSSKTVKSVGNLKQKKHLDKSKLDDEIVALVGVVSEHQLFKPSALIEWLRFKKAEFQIYDQVKEVSKTLRFVTRNDRLQECLVNAGSYALVLNVPPLDDISDEILKKMKKLASDRSLTDIKTKTNKPPTKMVGKRRRHFETSDDTDEDSDDSEESNSKSVNAPWCTNRRKCKSVLDKVKQLAEFQKKNKATYDQVLYLIAVNSEIAKRFECTYSIYQSDRLIKAGIVQLPRPPKDMQVHLRQPAARYNAPSGSDKSWFNVSWTYEDPGYPVKFLIQYKSKRGTASDWAIPQKVTFDPDGNEAKVVIRNPTTALNSTLEFRMAVDTCIGRSDFSSAVETDVVAMDTRKSTGRRDWNDDSLDYNPYDDYRMSDESNEDDASQYVDRIRIAGKREEDRRRSDALRRNASVRSNITVLRNPSSVGLGRNYSFRGDERRAQPNVHVDRSISMRSNVSVRSSASRWGADTKFNDLEGARNKMEEETIELKEPNKKRFCESILGRCNKIGERNGLTIYDVPLTKTAEFALEAKNSVERYSFEAYPGSSKFDRREHKTILVMGATGTGKTTLINGMINYVFDVEWEDPFRFHLIQESTSDNQSVSQTSRITAYDIQYCDGFRIPYTLTIIDTPGYGDTLGIKRDEEITEQVRLFFQDKNGIQDVDVIGFVAPASAPRLTATQLYIFNSVLAIFGNDVKDNIRFLLTFADSHAPPVLTAISEADLPCPKDSKTGLPLHHKFNSSGFFCSNKQASSSGVTASSFNQFFWRMGMSNFEQFFRNLPMIETRSLSLTKEVLEQRKQLETTIEGLQPLVKLGLTKMEEMRKIKQMVSQATVKIKANENIKFEVDIIEARMEKIPDGDILTNCNVCHVTCHRHCVFKNDNDKAKCSAMNRSLPVEKRTCTVCPNHCMWYKHSNQNYQWVYVLTKRQVSSDEMRKRYELEQNRKMTAEDLLVALEQEVEDTKRKVLERVNTVAQCIQRLDAIALRPNPFSTPEYIDLVINAEEQDKKPGYLERIKSLKELRSMSSFAIQIMNNEDIIPN